MAATDIAGSGLSPYTLPLHEIAEEIYEQHSIRSYSSPEVEICFGMVRANENFIAKANH